MEKTLSLTTNAIDASIRDNGRYHNFFLFGRNAVEVLIRKPEGEEHHYGAVAINMLENQAHGFYWTPEGPICLRSVGEGQEEITFDDLASELRSAGANALISPLSEYFEGEPIAY